jgi:hypothetical protein
MPDTMTFTGSLTRISCWCGIHFAIPSQLEDFRQRKHDQGDDYAIRCPLGHTLVPAGESKVDKLERRLQFEKEERARVTAEREQAEASARAHKGAATKARKRAAAAVCPVPGCGRSFVQLRRHMQAKHPEYDPAAAS